MSLNNYLAQITNPVLEPAIGSDIEAARSGSLFMTILTGVLSFMMLLGILLVLMNLIQAGIDWVGSGGDKGKIEKARNRIVNAVIGIIILSAAVAIWNLVRQFLGIDLSFSNLFIKTGKVAP